MTGPEGNASRQSGEAGLVVPQAAARPAVETILLAVTRVGTKLGEKQLTNATGFYFARDDRLYLVTSRHVLIDEANDHRPDRIEIELHLDPLNVAAVSPFSIPLYSGQCALWRETSDCSGIVDVAAVELDRSALPQRWLMHAFTPSHLVEKLHRIEAGTLVSIVGFPLGFHDTLHHLPVVRQAMIASSFGIRFGGYGYFLTDARMHRGASGAPVVARAASGEGGRTTLSWLLLGVHAARLDVDRDVEQDSRLSLNCAWYSDVLMTLTEVQPQAVLAGAAGGEGDVPDLESVAQMHR